MQKWFLILVLFSSFVHSGCSRTPLLVDRVLVKNASDGKVTEVKIHHEPTNRIGGVNAILPQESLDIGFPNQPLLARQAIIQWRDRQGQDRIGKIVIPYDSDAAKDGRVMSLIYILHPTGTASAHLQDSILLDYR